jgi:putative toxin-antitoxin system antitoxin component (TIGR02293 family)
MAGPAIVHDSLIGGNEPRYAYAAFYRAAPVDRIKVIKAGVSARQLKLFISDLHFEQKTFFQALRLKTATVNKKAAAGQALTADESERVLGLAKLVGQLEVMLEESGDTAGFDANLWLSRWLHEPLPALGNRKPMDLLDTMEGQALVSQALAQIQSGAYA